MIWRPSHLHRVLFTAGLLIASAFPLQRTTGNQFMRGTDVSALTVLEDHGASYFDGGVAGDALEILESNGVNWHRLRIFVDPSGSDPIAVQDLTYTINLAQRTKARGAKLLLDFHYSDTWADPGRQLKPSAWTTLAFPQLEQQVYDYTRDVIAGFGSAGVLPDMVQIGNEISSGMLWEDGRLWRPGVPEDLEFDNLAALLSAGIRGARDGAGAGNEPQMMIHHDKGANWGASSYYFDRLLPRLQSNGTDIDAIGYSYYPKFHYDPTSGNGGLADVQQNLSNTSSRYNKSVVVVEAGFASRGAVYEPDYEFEVSPAGQHDFLAALVATVQAVPDQLGRGVFWWYPETVPVDGLNVWEGGRYGLFDEQSELLPAADVFAAFVPFLPGDFDNSGVLDCGDIDALVTEIASGGNNPAFDLTGDGLVNLADRDAWLVGAGAVLNNSGNPILLGDANLDAIVDGLDFIAWSARKFTPTAAWCSGDFTASGVVDGLDFIEWNANKFTSADGGASAVPEPSALGLLAVWLAALLLARHCNMENISMLRSGTLACLLAVGTSCALGTERSRECFNDEWRFDRYGPMPDGSERPEPLGLESPTLKDAGWRSLRLPHDWGVEGPFREDLPGSTGKLPWAGVGWYRKHFSFSPADRGKRVFVDFDGAMSDATVFINGHKVGGWPYGYNSFRVELTEHIDFEAGNVIAVRLDNKQGSSRWYPGGGIYRNVWLVKTNPLHLDHWGTFVTSPKVSRQQAVLQIAVTVKNQSDSSAKFRVVTEILAPVTDSRRDPTSVRFSPEYSVVLKAGATDTWTQQATMIRPRLWSLEDPWLYTAVTKIIREGKVVDQYRTSFGIRTISFDAKQGFLLNGKATPLRGVCLHHDLGPLGAAVYTRGIQRQLELLQQMGCNAIRTSHNPPAPELLDLCDRMGMLVQVEAFDCWAIGKTGNDYSRFFSEWHQRDLTAMVRRDRNHPCVIMWSTGNEVREQHGPDGLNLAEKLASIVRQLDSTRPVTVGCDLPQSGSNGFQNTVDVFGYNYKPHLYADFLSKNPQLPLYGSETASCISSRGEYFFPVVKNKDGGRGGPFQMSSYDLYAPPWATAPDVEFAAQQKLPQLLGEFVWTGFDYLGEPTPYNDDLQELPPTDDPQARAALQNELEETGRIRVPSRSSYFGILDLCGFKKDRFYLYQAHWRPDLPVAHILPHWNWPQRVGKVTPVHVYTSGEEAELLINGRSLGRKKKEQFQFRLEWSDVIYEPGELRVIAYKDGRRWAEGVRRTTGDASAIQLAADRARIEADGCDLCFLTVRVEDEAGQLVPRAKPLVRFTIDGPGELIAVGNGDATSHQPFQADQITTFNGLCLAVVRSVRYQSGTITVKATSEGLIGDQVRISTR